MTIFCVWKKTQKGFISPPVIYIIISTILFLVSLSSGPATPDAQDNVVTQIPERPRMTVATTTSKVQVIDKIASPKTEDVKAPSVKSETIPQQPVIKNVPPGLYEVVRVIDGDTVDVSINGKTERLRLIGINTPETVDPRKPVECFGVEASNRAKAILTGKRVRLESDNSQGELDKYDRLLRYVFLEDGTNFNLLMIKEGYAYEYTYDLPYKYQSTFKQAQKDAELDKLGLWGDVCQNSVPVQTPVVAPATTQPQTVVVPIVLPSTDTSNNCTIKGNINSKKEKIYHMIGCGSYNQTIIEESKGERWFCTEQEALGAGWRKALNCN